MKREEFFERLFQGLEKISQEERSRIQEYYMELLLDKMEEGQPEEQVIEGFGRPEEIAQRIRGEQEGFRSSGSQLPAVNSAQGEQEGIYTPRGEIDSFEVRAQDTQLRLYPSRDGRFRVRYHPHENEIVTVREENGCFIFRHEIPLFARIFSFWKIGRGPISVEVPGEMIRRFHAATSNSAVTVEGLCDFDEGSIMSSNAKVSVRNVTGGSLECRTSNSSMVLEDCEVRQLTAETSNGGISCGRCTGEKLGLKTSNARIEANRLEYADIRLKTSNGGLRGTIRGDIREYVIDSGTSNGSSNLPSWGDNRCTRRLYAHTSNASIKIEFV